MTIKQATTSGNLLSSLFVVRVNYRWCIVGCPTGGSCMAMENFKYAFTLLYIKQLEIATKRHALAQLTADHVLTDN